MRCSAPKLYRSRGVFIYAMLPAYEIRSHLKDPFDDAVLCQSVQSHFLLPSDLGRRKLHSTRSGCRMASSLKLAFWLGQPNAQFGYWCLILAAFVTTL